MEELRGVLAVKCAALWPLNERHTSSGPKNPSAK